MDSYRSTILFLIVLMALSATFSASETALTAANKIRLKNLAEDGDKRAAGALKLAEKTGMIACVKGAVTVIASPEGKIAMNTAGNAGMATAGSGDVLSGIIGSLLAQGLDPWNAACCGVHLHALAGDFATQKGMAGMIASDMIEALPAVLGSLGR